MLPGANGAVGPSGVAAPDGSALLDLMVYTGANEAVDPAGANYDVLMVSFYIQILKHSTV